MKLEYLQPRSAAGLPLYPVRIKLDNPWAQDLNRVRLAPASHSGHCVYFNSAAEALVFILSYTD